MENYEIIKSIECGHFKEVKLVRCQWSGEIRLVRQSSLVTNDTNKSDLSVLNRLSSIRHPCVLQCQDWFCDKNGHIQIIYQYCNIVTLADRIDQITSRNAFYPEPVLMAHFAQICMGVAYLDQLNIPHSSLSPANVLLSCLETVKLTDVGVSGDTFGALTHCLREMCKLSSGSGSNLTRFYGEDFVQFVRSLMEPSAADCGIKWILSQPYFTVQLDAFYKDLIKEKNIMHDRNRLLRPDGTPCIFRKPLSDRSHMKSPGGQGELSNGDSPATSSKPPIPMVTKSTCTSPFPTKRMLTTMINTLSMPSDNLGVSPLNSPLRRRRSKTPCFRQHQTMDGIKAVTHFTVKKMSLLSGSRPRSALDRLENVDVNVDSNGTVDEVDVGAVNLRIGVPRKTNSESTYIDDENMFFEEDDFELFESETPDFELEDLDYDDTESEDPSTVFCDSIDAEQKLIVEYNELIEQIKYLQGSITAQHNSENESRLQSF